MENQNVAANYEAYQAQQQEALAFFNRVKNDLTSEGETKIVQTLVLLEESILKARDKGSVYDLTVDEYCLLGNLTYLVGLDMTSTREKFMKMPVKNFFERFTEVKLVSKEFCDTITSLLKVVKEENIVKTKDELKEYLLKSVKGETEQIHNLRLDYKKAFKSFEIPVQFAVGLSEIMSNKSLTYQDMLNMNSMIYEHVRFSRHSIKNTINIFRSEFYVKSIQEAERRAQTQRFSIVYFDSILSAVELIERHADAFEFLHDEKKRDEYEYVEPMSKEDIEKKENEEAVNKEKEERVEPEWDPKYHPTDPEIANRFNVDHPDFFLRCTMEEHLGGAITKPADIITAMDKILANGDYASHLYQWMAQNKFSPKRVDYKETWGTIMPDSIKAAIADRVDEKQEEYKKAVELITKDIPDENINRIITYVNDVIQNLIIEGAQQKGYLLTQTFENQIKTWKHLQEMLQIIEKQYIDGSQYDSYVILYNYLNENTDFKEIMKNIETYQRNEVELSVYNQLKQFIFPKKDAQAPEVKVEVEREQAEKPESDENGK